MIEEYVLDIEGQQEKIRSINESEFKRYKEIIDGTQNRDENQGRNLAHTNYFKFFQRLIMFEQNLIHGQRFYSLHILKSPELIEPAKFYIQMSGWDFFVAIFSLFEDFVTLVLDHDLSSEEYDRLRINKLNEILDNPEIYKLVKENYPDQFKKLIKKEKFIPVARKINCLFELYDLKNTDDSIYLGELIEIRNLIHNNGFYRGESKELKKLNIILKDRTMVQGITIPRILEWVERIFKIKFEICKKIVHKNIIDNAPQI